MTFRLRLALVAALVVAIVVAAASAVVYFVMRNELRHERRPRICSSSASGRAAADSGDALHARLRRSLGRLRRSVTPLMRGRHPSPANELEQVPIDARTRSPSQRRNATRSSLRRASDTSESRIYTVLARSSTRAASPVRRRAARAPDSTTSTATLHRLQLILLLVSLGGLAAGAARGALVSRAALVAGAPPDRDGGAHRRDGRAERARPGQRPRRAHAPRHCVQHDARRARGVARDAAPLRRRRVARAAHAADEHADEHRGAEAARAARSGRARRVSSPTSSARRTRCAT